MLETNSTLSKILELIKKNGINEKELLLSCKINTSFFSDWKSGKLKNPSIDKIKIIANYFHVSTDYLLGNDKKIFPFQSEQDEVANMTQEAFETRRVLFSKLDTTSVEDMKKAIAIIDMLKGTNNE